MYSYVSEKRSVFSLLSQKQRGLVSRKQSHADRQTDRLFIHIKISRINSRQKQLIVAYSILQYVSFLGVMVLFTIQREAEFGVIELLLRIPLRRDFLWQINM